MANSRKVVQIIPCPASKYLYALCSDGSIWMCILGMSPCKWIRLEEIPND